MVYEKREQYEDLIRRVRESYQNNPGGLSWCEACEEINLWTYWQGRDCEKVRILLVGQDWGCVSDSGGAALVSRITGPGFSSQEYMEGNSSITDCNLVKLFDSIDYDVSGKTPTRKDLFFTNLVLGYRTGKISGNFRPEWAEHDGPFFRELVDILQPAFIFCLGRDTFSGVLSALSIQCPPIASYNAFLRSNENPVAAQLESGHTVRVCALAHCGSLGTMNRNRRWDEQKGKMTSDTDLTNQIEDWKWVMREEYARISCHKLVRDRIPEIIESGGKTCIWETLSAENYLQMLDEKLNEVLSEYRESKSIEKLADLLEVMQAVVRARGWTMEQLEQVRTEKTARCGGFEKKILLKEVSSLS